MSSHTAQQSSLDKSASPVDFVNRVLSEAVRMQASDVHLEPYTDLAKLRFRLDGRLACMNAGAFLSANYSAIVSRIKVQARLDIAERRLPQDGSFSFNQQGRRVDVRVSVLPTLFGERLVLRLLAAAPSNFDLSALGMSASHQALLRSVSAANQGMVLATGPTGSGKSTTLYAILKQMDRESNNVLAVEDPVEQRLTGIGQTQVNDEIGLNFAAVLRAFLRQDPEVILVGEIRDSETADIAVKAALSGHLVLSTLHTRDAATSISRLSNLGVPAHLLAAAVSLVIAQRLLRLTCRHCREPDTQGKKIAAALNLSVEQARSASFYCAVGCRHCAYTGYHGRQGVFELLLAEQAIRQAIAQSADADALRCLMERHSQASLRDQARSLVCQGIISLAEYQRVLA